MRTTANYDRKRMYLDHLDSVRHFAESHPDMVVHNPRAEILAEMLKEETE